MENRREKKKEILKRKGMLLAAITLLICIFSNTTLARQTEIPENLIEEKESKISQMQLGAPATISLSGVYNKNDNNVILTWDKLGLTRVYREISYGNQSLIQTVNGQATVISDAIDAEKPAPPTVKTSTDGKVWFDSNGKKINSAINMPRIDTTEHESDIGNYVSISGNDSGTSYRYRVEQGAEGNVRRKKRCYFRPTGIS